MLAQYESREQCIADLEVHGWQPVKAGDRDPRSYVGVLNAQQRGFAVSKSMAGVLVIEIAGATNLLLWSDPVPCDWNELGITALAAIVGRIRSDDDA